ncbi:chemotaxis protein CheY [Bacillus coahuilensis m2-6]|uniref:Chemotaxis protein CheY n=1 Tax=Bacillus coahuilensis p1.1.43 TaxID=1150625 RepID=A0A147K6P6_9BACI|nr:response regulator transcription factor [Bacillus coahuilensis]KUP05577.1 chemotaxis protein CheY [Bacillus coahuilensis p1.1.43]KUP06651.1 chemotaxis protein CheY [Bacillus coahuilensis m2-6]
MSKKILVVDDEQSIVTLLKYNLEQAGYTVLTANDGEEGYELAMSDKPDFIVLDLMLPKMDGIEVCKNLRQQKMMTPILMLTAKDDEFDKVLGLELGADDYMTKPFSPREVVARIKAILRRTQTLIQSAVEEQDPKDYLKVGELKVYPEHYEAYIGEELLELTPKEFELLLYLTENKGRVLTRDQLLSAVWNYDFAGDTRIVDVHISHLRDKIEQNTKKPIYIKTIRGLGYKLEEPKVS